MADTHSHSHHVRHGSDMAAAFTGLLVGAVALLLLIGSIVMLTNRHYANEQASTEVRR